MLMFDLSVKYRMKLSFIYLWIVYLKRHIGIIRLLAIFEILGMIFISSFYTIVF